MSPGTTSAIGSSRSPTPARTTQQVVVTRWRSDAAALAPLPSWVNVRRPEMATMVAMMRAVEGSCAPGWAAMTSV